HYGLGRPVFVRRSAFLAGGGGGWGMPPPGPLRFGVIAVRWEDHRVAAAVEKLESPEYEQVWDRFERRFEFRPGMQRRTWPAIKEPADSITWSLAALDNDPGYVKLDAMVDVVNSGLWACTPPEQTLLILDWQQPISTGSCYGESAKAQSRDEWPTSDFYVAGGAVGTNRMRPV
ncbi:DUF2716 domain-containing protein, partial [Actinoplanes sp. NPDC048791]|uniref:DUF2716 domain-containing protein n=1 Tax=Actinoplanes sp. NPDC048791 TaxID=3154623 RepID=UPI0033F42F55